MTGEQELLFDSSRRFLDDTSPLSVVRQLVDDPIGYDPTWWRRGAQLGWTALLLDGGEGDGAAEFGLVELAGIAELFGAGVQPGPLLSVNVVASALDRLGTDVQREKVLAPLVGGDEVATWCHAERSDRWTGGALETTARPDGRSYVLQGTKRFVIDAGWSSHLLVSATGPAGVCQFLVDGDSPGIRVRPRKCLDISRRLYDVEFDSVTVGPDALVGEPGLAAAEIGRQLRVALVLQCAELVGLMDRIFSSALAYAKERVAFGRPIGSYQAIKHRFADLYCTLEASKATASAAAHATADDSPEAEILTSVAKAYVGEAATSLISECQQIFGGIAMTWDHDLHLYLRRATVNAALYGTPVEHREHLDRLVSVT